MLEKDPTRKNYYNVNTGRADKSRGGAMARYMEPLYVFAHDVEMEGKSGVKRDRKGEFVSMKLPTVTISDVLFALRKQGRPMFGATDKMAFRDPKTVNAQSLWGPPGGRNTTGGMF